jgi:hypothetical protein
VRPSACTHSWGSYGRGETEMGHGRGRCRGVPHAAGCTDDLHTSAGATTESPAATDAECGGHVSGKDAMTGHGFWWHVFNDSVRDNPWSLGFVSLPMLVMIVYAVSPWRPWSRRWWIERERRRK